MRRLILLAALATLLAAPTAGRAAGVAAYRGLATWVDIYDVSTWANPEAAAARMRARGVSTILLETSNSDRAYDIRTPALVARFVEAAHANGLRIVSWYLPGLRNLARDRRRALAALTFTTPSGQRFDSFGLDIESTAVKRPDLRNARLVELSSDLRAAAGPDYPLAAIIPSPRGMELLPAYWPGFPYADLAAVYDVFVPMTYYTYRTRTKAATRDYLARSFEILREQTGDPEVAIHAAGGLAGRSRGGQVGSFVEAACESGVLGVSLYDWETTRPGQWGTLRRFADCAP
jgi:hypothetical protein